MGLAGLALAGASLAGPMPRPKSDGEVCGTAALVGRVLPRETGEGGCGIAVPVRLAVAAGVALEPPATVACETARTFAGWLEAAAKPEFAARGARLEAVTVADAYSCRGRNRKAGAKLSEHAFGRAIDISGFRLGDGTEVTVREDWGTKDWGPVLRRAYDAACGRFGTVLGPEANALHADHLHLDVAARRSPYCE